MYYLPDKYIKILIETIQIEQYKYKYEVDTSVEWKTWAPTGMGKEELAPGNVVKCFCAANAVSVYALY